MTDCSEDALGVRARQYQLVVLDFWKWLVEMMQQRLPFLILRRLAKALGMIFQRVPLDQQDVPVAVLHTFL